MKYSQVKEYIVIPVLKQMSIPYSEEAVEILLMTMAHESLGGVYIKQIEGPACGPYNMEPATHDDIWSNYLDYRDELTGDVDDWAFASGTINQDIGNMYYATAMARVHYWRVSEALPKRDYFTTEREWLVDMANYAKDHYNTHLGKATPEKYLSDYLRWRNEG